MFSITIVPRCGLMRSPQGRPMVSKAPPGGNGTISRTGRAGYFCAKAECGSRIGAHRAAAPFARNSRCLVLMVIGVPPEPFPQRRQVEFAFSPDATHSGQFRSI